MRTRGWISAGILLVACGGSGKNGGVTLDAGGNDGGLVFDADPDARFDSLQDGLDPDGACAASRTAADVAPVALYVMFESANSMAVKWTPATSGMKTFLKDPISAGLDVALAFFPRPPDGTPVCDQHQYQVPVVPFDLLPKNADPIIAAMAAKTADGFNTPIYPALGGAILGARDEAKAKPGYRGAVLLVTDGAPEGPAPTCSGVDPNDPAVIAGIAAAGLSLDPPVRTFVIGLPGVHVDFANQVAAAGGTDGAIIISDPSTIEAEFEKALVKVKGESLPCDFPIPPKVKDGEVAFDHVNVSWTKTDGSSVDLLQNPGCAGGDGWYYDASPPTRIILCPKSCSDVRSDPKAAVTILLGCQTKIR